MITQESTTKEINQELIELIQRNPAIYGLVFDGYENGKIIYSNPSSFAIRDAKIDLELFRQRQEAIDTRKSISEGDFVIRKNGEYERVSVSQWGDSIQAGKGGSIYINQSGRGSHSGSCGDLINRNNLRLTDETKEGSCWIFQADRAGAHRAVYHVLKFKVYQEI